MWHFYSFVIVITIKTINLKELFAKLLNLKYSYLILMFYTQLYGFK